MTKSKKTESRAQKARVNGGIRTQNIVSSIIKSMGFESSKPPVIRIAQCPTYSMNVDNWISTHKILFEVTRCVKDAKLFKILIQAENFKKQYPDNRFIVVLTHQPRRDSVYIEHLKNSPFIDDVFFIWNDEYVDSKVKTQKDTILSKFSDYLNDIAVNKLISDQRQIKETLHLELGDRFIPIIDKVTKNLIESSGTTVKEFLISGNLSQSLNQLKFEFV